ncbi:hypothetical protein [Paenimyroides baculatum]|uniref:Uncharacterized protein n=1 Tax=Paenimyroides baculatum TaxID=2608000 RepID=A0A5M6CEB4_9FLAO|nr:hypothetical protein [Paenimyroides baculatum]KAA5532790.1 hypothetical protein F0460_13170 [Paenimyroides baculatum]
MNVTFTFKNETVRKAYCMLTGEVITDEQIVEQFGNLDPIDVGDGMAELEQIAFLSAIISLVVETKKRDRAKSKFEQKLEEIKENYKKKI